MGVPQAGGDAVSARPSVVVVQRRMTHYRVPLFERLREQLAARGMALRVLYGEGTAEEREKQDEAELAWGEKLDTAYLCGGRVCWQPFMAAANGADLVVVTPENKLVANLIPQFFAPQVRIGLWGHGGNLQGDPESLRERFKRVVARHADWWFGYTGMSVPLILESGFPRERITVLDNAVDTGELAALRRGVQQHDLEALRESLGLAGRRVGVFVGSLYPEKRIGFLLESALAVRRRVPDFELLVIGAGPLAEEVERFCAQHAWARYLGPRKGRAKVEAVALGQVMLNPGLVGLGILDSFVCRVPMFTTDCGIHSPEIAYLENGHNGVMTANTLESYAEAVVQGLGHPPTLELLQAGCGESAARYTVERMAGNFVDGMVRCLGAPPYRRH